MSYCKDEQITCNLLAGLQVANIKRIIVEVIFLDLESSCGKSSSNGRIVGGKNAIVRRWPWSVSCSYTCSFVQ